ncbi:MAG: hypothetical protein IKE40_07285 [Firmicutes bacterium]|nr:hypothetical protein [Bacillota bacterium]
MKWRKREKHMPPRAGTRKKSSRRAGAGVFPAYETAKKRKTYAAASGNSEKSSRRAGSQVLLAYKTAKKAKTYAGPEHEF